MGARRSDAKGAAERGQRMPPPHGIAVSNENSLYNGGR
jgi:hypothetical protein